MLSCNKVSSCRSGTELRAEAPGASRGQQRALQPGNVLSAAKSCRIGWLGLEFFFFFLLNVNENRLGKGYFCRDWRFVGIVFYKLAVA